MFLKSLPKVPNNTLGARRCVAATPAETKRGLPICSDTEQGEEEEAQEGEVGNRGEGPGATQGPRLNAARRHKQGSPHTQTLYIL